MKKYIVILGLLFTHIAHGWTFYAIQTNNLPASVNVDIELVANNIAVESKTIQAGQHFTTTEEYPQGATLIFTINGQKTTIPNTTLNKHKNFNILGIGAENFKDRK